jgi:PAS domain S-box-containing protein
MSSSQSLDLLEGIAAPIVATNLEGTIIYWSTAAQEVLGFSSQEMKFRSWWEHFPATERERVMAAFQPAKAGVTFGGTCAMKHRDGATIPVVAHVSVLLDQNLLPQALLTVLHKIDASSQDHANLASDAANRTSQ